jgi:hypothetical protein
MDSTIDDLRAEYAELVGLARALAPGQWAEASAAASAPTVPPRCCPSGA